MAKVNAENRSRNRYTDEEKRKCVAICKSMGGLTDDAVLACQNMLPSVSRSTLGDWLVKFGEEIGPTAIEVVNNNEDAALAVRAQNNKLVRAQELLLNKLNDKDFIDGTTNLLHVATSLGIVRDHIFKQAGLPIEQMNKVKRLFAVWYRKGLDPDIVIEDVISSYEELPDIISTKPITVSAVKEEGDADGQK